MNPPFGRKEVKEAQTNFGYKTGATQVLFLQHVLKSTKTGMQDAVYDLKAVSPNRAPEEDMRTPAELLDFIAAKGRQADALARLRERTR